jgi:hypothetical protein
LFTSAYRVGAKSVFNYLAGLALTTTSGRNIELILIRHDKFGGAGASDTQLRALNFRTPPSTTRSLDTETMERTNAQGLPCEQMRVV